MKVEHTEDYNSVTSIHKSVRNIGLPRKVKRKLDEKHIDNNNKYLPSEEERHVDKYV